MHESSRVFAQGDVYDDNSVGVGADEDELLTFLKRTLFFVGRNMLHWVHYKQERRSSSGPVIQLQREWNSAPNGFSSLAGSSSYGAVMPATVTLELKGKVIVSTAKVDPEDPVPDVDKSHFRALPSTDELTPEFSAEPSRPKKISVVAVQKLSSVLPAMARERWGNKLEFLLAVIGFAVDLGNIWRFPYICYKNGGGAFLLPYMIMFIFGGLPLFYLELALGQYQHSGCISIWRKVCPLFKGIGFAICIVNSYMAFFYNTIIGWAVYYFFSSFRAEVPWKRCGNEWNTPSCVELSVNSSVVVQGNATNKTTSPAQEFFYREVLEIHRSSGLEDLGGVKPTLALCSMLVFVIVYFALWKGPRSSGKAVWITATMPYVVLFILLIRGVTLPGASTGIRYYLTPNWTRLIESEVWIDAATQIFFSLGPGFGVLMALSSYNDFHNNCYKDAIVTSLVNCFTSFISGFVIFSTLGYMAERQNVDIAQVAGKGGPGLIFIVYPQAIATMGGSSFWAIIFFFMLITLGIDSTFGGLEAVITAFCDEFPSSIGKRRELFVLGLVIYCFSGSLLSSTYGGNYLVEFLDHYGVSFPLLLIVSVEAMAICWLYGVARFSNNVREMLGFIPNIYWRSCWNVVSPVFIMIIFLCACIFPKPLQAEGYDYPAWSVYIGWAIRLSSLLCIPGYMVYKLSILKGPLMKRIKTAVTAPGARGRGHEGSLTLSNSENSVEANMHTYNKYLDTT